MPAELLARIEADPDYQALVRRRGRFGWLLTVLTLIVFFGFIALVAFDKAVLAAPVGDGVTSIGIPVGLGVILFSIAVTAIYVVRANAEFDRLRAKEWPAQRTSANPSLRRLIERL